MAAPDITLGVGQMLVVTKNSGLGITIVGGKPLSFGEIASIYSTSNCLQVGDPVMFYQENGTQIMYGSTIYTLIEEQNVSGKEVIPP